MKRNILKAKINRNGLKKYAGTYFRDHESQVCRLLSEEGKAALFGIEREDGVYTLIGEESVYFSAVSGQKGEIPLAVFSAALQLNALSKGKSGDFEFVAMNDQKELVWLYNKATMEALWNIILWLESLNEEKKVNIK
ncbi:hypothetical protein [Flavobacterium cerinum]|uniref:Uncharacterized protein n=1 Tax=Flavobacterium cerinum TaxID=2502784 RepID=A0ABY5IYF2_9FLAO|nr:hypothetical protein [Flavobacterium cerinum]UUC46758.1 hypothetical protein NOX80_06040 [Flavobacterium cerinum]